MQLLAKLYLITLPENLETCGGELLPLFLRSLDAHVSLSEEPCFCSFCEALLNCLKAVFFNVSLVTKCSCARCEGVTRSVEVVSCSARFFLTKPFFTLRKRFLLTRCFQFVETEGSKGPKTNGVVLLTVVWSTLTG